MNKLIIYSFIIFLTIQIQVNGQILKFDRITSLNGLSHNDVNSIMQDKQGFIWIGTADGLNKYDGYKFHIYKNDPNNNKSLSYNWITSLKQDKKGNIWIGTRNGLNKYDPVTDRFIVFTNNPKDETSISSNYINCIYEDKKGDLWFGTTKGLNKLDPQTNKFNRWISNPKDTNSIAGNVVLSIFEDSEDIFWIGTRSGLDIFNKQKNTFKHFKPNQKDPNSLNYDVINCIFEDNQGTLWIGTELYLAKLFKNDKKTGKFTNVFTKREDNLANVVSIIQDKDGYIWTTSWQYGVNRFSPNNERMIYLNKEDDPNSISFNSVTAICEDQAGIIWIATAGYGINKADKKKIKFAQVTKESNNTNSLVSNYITAIYKNNDNKIWLGNGEGKGLNMYDSVTRKYCVFAYNPADPNSFPDPQGNVYAIEKDSRGTLWIGSRGGLIQIIDKNPPAYFSASNIHFKNYYHNSKNSNSLNSNVVRAIFADKNYLWIGTDGGLHKLNLNDYYLNNGKQPIFEKFINIADDNKSISDNRIRKIIQDKNGYLWIATAKGLNKYNPQNNEFTQFLRDTTIKNSINQDYIWALCSDADGNIWVGTNGGGLNKIDGKTGIISHFTEKEGLINNGIRGLILDKNNNLWITTNKGLSMFNTKNQTFKNYKVKDGLVGNDFNGGAYFIHNNGEIFIGGNNGYNHFFPDQITENAYEPSVVLTDFQILNKNVEISDNSPIQQSISFAKKITLSYVDYVFSFEFSSLHYSSPEENKYKYMLEGFDNDWIYTDASKRFATYTNLDPGTYIFKVAGTNSDNIWSKNEISITIEVQPPFWKTWLFRVSTFLFIVFLIFGIFRYRINNIKNQKVALEKQVSERTFEIQEKNKLLTQQKEEIEARRMEEERKNQVLELQQNEIMLQKEELVIKNQLLFDSNEDIKASIRYAQSIQNSILPINHVVSKNFDHFIIFKPKDIVSGDFYWYSQIKDTFFLAVIDCTGHGVPGAFMSLIGYNLLNRIVNVFQIHSPKEIINTLDKELRIALQQNEKENNDGMELCLCKIQPTVPNEYLVTFSGAKRKLWAYHNDSNILAIYPAERRSIGGYHNIKPPAYTDRQIIMKSNDNLYLFSDGIVDQNAPNRKRFGSERLFKLLHSIATLPTQEQGEIIENELNSYQSNESQRDDITMWGIKLK